MNIAIIFAAGIGQRLNSENNLPKQFLQINEKPILIHTLEHFQNHKKIDKIYIATLEEYINTTEELIKKYNINKAKKIVKGGSCAMESIYNALSAAKSENPDDSIVLIHDGVRPILNSEVIDNNIESVIKNGNAITIVPCVETIVVSQDKNIANSVPIRKETFKAQAPQSFRLGEIIEAHNIEKADSNYLDVVDNCTLYMKQNRKVYLVEGNFGNIKITTPEDVYILKGILDFIKAKENKIVG
ncbi:2-C-methyl-D-erythritol 4-phosphate cytidylyltransferase [bacterium]|nr:2-C-methyl-D-erythritol 4-phosphate cytidylyltransferase [bacterium]MBQ9149513.1 2-C-methyl-D-erythritol 4-phosphate cytidylyltransferase [bacterium]